MTVVKVWCALLHTWHVYISSVCMYILHCVLCLFTALPPVCNALSRYSCTINIKHNGHYIVEMKITLSEKHGILKCYDRKNPVLGLLQPYYGHLSCIPVVYVTHYVTI